MSATASATREVQAARAAWWLVFAIALGALVAGAPSVTRTAPSPPAPSVGAARLLWGLTLDLNRAPAVALEALPGIGPGRAAAIVAARPFCRVRELTRVRGIGPVTLARVQGALHVSRAPAHCADGARK